MDPVDPGPWTDFPASPRTCLATAGPDPELWIDLLAQPQTCLIATSLAGALDSCSTLAASNQVCPAHPVLWDRALAGEDRALLGGVTTHGFPSLWEQPAFAVP